MVYIKKEDAIKAMNEAINDRTWSMNDKDVIEQMQENVEALPATNVAEVKHGEWITDCYQTQSTRGHLIRNKTFICSNCNRRNGKISTNYCSNCGAKMEKRF